MSRNLLRNSTSLALNPYPCVFPCIYPWARWIRKSCQTPRTLDGERLLRDDVVFARRRVWWRRRRCWTRAMSAPVSAFLNPSKTKFYAAKFRCHFSFHEFRFSLALGSLASLFFLSPWKASTDHHVASSNDGVRWLLIATRRIKHDRDEVSEYLTREGTGERKGGELTVTEVLVNSRLRGSGRLSWNGGVIRRKRQSRSGEES